MPAALVMKEPDLGTALLICATGFAIMILAGLDLRVVGGRRSAGRRGRAVPVTWCCKPYQYTRLVSFMNPEADKSGAGYHIVQSKIALGSGGLLGKGFGLGTQSQLNFLPEKQTDFMFASLAEEFGFVGCIVDPAALCGGDLHVAAHRLDRPQPLRPAGRGRRDGDAGVLRADERGDGDGPGARGRACRCRCSPGAAR